MKPIILMGSGGHANVLIDILRLLNIEILGYTDSSAEEVYSDIKYLGNDDSIKDFEPCDILLVNAIGLMPGKEKRILVHEAFKKDGFNFATVIHPSAIISDTVDISEGSQIMAGVIIQANTLIGPNCIINTGSNIDHDCIIGSSVHIAPGSTLSGNVVIDDYAHIGTGTSIIEGRKIGKNSIIAAGSVIYDDVQENEKIIQKRS